MNYDAQESRARIGGSSVALENAISRIVDEHIGNLSDVIDKIKSMLQDDTDILTDQEIEDILSASNVKTDEILDITTGIDENL